MQKKIRIGTCCLFALSIMLTSTSPLTAQSFYAFPPVNDVSFRGLSAVSNNIVWISGSGGTVGRSLNGGRFFEWISVPGYAKTEFRDIEAFNDKEAVIMGITDPAVLLKTVDAGKSWQKVYSDSTHHAFFDAISFSGTNGILVGDPVNRKPLLVRSSDKGGHWAAVSSAFLLSDTAEAFFAASGGNVLLKPDGRFLLVSGGSRSFIYSADGWKDSLPLLQGGNSTGANAIAADPSDTSHYYIVGGDFSKDSLRSGTAMSLYTNPRHMQPPETPPSGYKSSVCFVDSNRLVACGTSGVDISSDGGLHWQKISDKSYNVCGKSPSGNKVFLAGGKGAVAVIDFP